MNRANYYLNYRIKICISEILSTIVILKYTANDLLLKFILLSIELNTTLTSFTGIQKV